MFFASIFGFFCFLALGCFGCYLQCWGGFAAICSTLATLTFKFDGFCHTLELCSPVILSIPPFPSYSFKHSTVHDPSHPKFHAEPPPLSFRCSEIRKFEVEISLYLQHFDIFNVRRLDRIKHERKKDRKNDRQID